MTTVTTDAATVTDEQVARTVEALRQQRTTRNYYIDRARKLRTPEAVVLADVECRRTMRVESTLREWRPGDPRFAAHLSRSFGALVEDDEQLAGIWRRAVLNTSIHKRDVPDISALLA